MAIGLDDVISEAQKFGGVGSQDFQQFADPYQKATSDIFAGFQGQMQDQFGDQLDEVNRKMYGNNVDPAKGIGQENISNLMTEQTNKLAPYAQQLSGQTGLQAITDYINQANLAGQTATGGFTSAKLSELQNMVNSGQITGENARSVLEAQGINPEEFMNDEQLATYQDQQALDKALVNVTDQGVKDSITSMDEFNHYMEYGNTFEDEVSDIMQNTADIKEWKKKLPDLTNYMTHWESALANEANAMFPSQSKMELYKARIAALEQAINDVKSGVVPVISGEAMS